MSTVVLVHGAWHGAWCWYKVVPLLQRAGHRVLVPDLPGHGRDAAPIGGATMQDYAQRVVDVMRTANEPVVLVGHSMGGMVISTAAEQQPDSVARLVYLAAMLLDDGQTTADVTAAGDVSRIGASLVVAPDGATLTVEPGALKEIFYGDCADADVALAQLLLGPESIAALGASIHTSAPRWGRIPRTYIECTHDQAISIGAQRAMTRRIPCEAVVTLHTDHSPFFSAPELLARQLLAL